MRIRVTCFLPVCGYLPLQFVGFSIFSRNHHNCIKIITIVCSFIIMTSSCLYLPYLGGPDCGRTKKPIQPTHESPLNHLWDPKLSELRPRTCVFFCVWGRGLANGFYFCVFQLTNSWDIPATLQAAARKCHQTHQPHWKQQLRPGFYQEIHGLIAIQVRV